MPSPSCAAVLGDDPRRPLYIETVPKYGYRLISESGPVPDDRFDLDHYIDYTEGVDLFFRGNPEEVQRSGGDLPEDHRHPPGPPGTPWPCAGLTKSMFFIDRYYRRPGEHRDEILEFGCSRRPIWRPTAPRRRRPAA